MLSAKEKRVKALAESGGNRLDLGAILAYPLVLARHLLGESAKSPLAAACCGEDYLDRITGSWNEKSGLFYDLMAPADGSGSRVNGWWTYYGLVKDCHSAYTVGSAVHYVLKTVDYLKRNGKPWKQTWVDRCQDVLKTVTDLQREDGAFGYTYSMTEKKVLDWSGFAGCWFAPALVYLTRITGEESWLAPAKKALRYYETFVRELNCYGSPMDTWKSVGSGRKPGFHPGLPSDVRADQTRGISGVFQRRCRV